MPKCKAVVLTIAATALAAATLVFAQNSPNPPGQDSLAKGFINPPDSAKPRTWWHWTNGNVTEDGITKDLEWMKRVGIGGFQLVDVASGNGQVVEPKINFGTPEWYHAVRHSAEARETAWVGDVDLQLRRAGARPADRGCKPEMAMKKLVWSETDCCRAGRTFRSKLPQPPSNEGPVRDFDAGARWRRCAALLRRSAPWLRIALPPMKCRWSRSIRRSTTSNGPIDGTRTARRQPEHLGEYCRAQGRRPGVAAVRICRSHTPRGPCRWEFTDGFPWARSSPAMMA